MYIHVGTMPKKKTTALHSAHAKMPTALHEALTILADLQGMTFSELMNNLGREELKRRGYVVEITGEKLAAEIARRKGVSSQ